MYIRKASRVYKGKTYFNYLLVESVLTPDGPRQKVVCSLGDLSPRPRHEWLALAHRLQSALSGQEELFPSPAAVSVLVPLLAKVGSPAAPVLSEVAGKDKELLPVRIDDVRCEQSREAGPVHVGYQFWQRLGLDKILQSAGLSEGARRLTLAMTLNRLIYPASELAMPEWIRTTALPDILDVDFDRLKEDALYRNLDKLHRHRVAIESALAERERNLFALDQTIFLYDVTSTYFEGRAMSNPKAQRGYSRDHRGDCKQVLVGLAVNRDGFPLAHEVFAGNRHDSTTLDDMLSTRVARYYRMEYDEEKKTFAYLLEENKRTAAEKLDGSYLLKTDREDLSAEEAWRIYMLLTRAEAAFRTLKSPLAERPIFHHKECRVEAHIFLCVLAYHLMMAIEKTLLDQGIHTSWETVREQLKTHQVNTIVLPTHGAMELRIRKATTPEPVHRELYQETRRRLRSHAGAAQLGAC